MSVHVVIVNMAAEDVSRVVKLKDAKTFQTWKFQISILMKVPAVFEAIKGDINVENLNKEIDKNE